MMRLLAIAWIGMLIGACGRAPEPQHVPLRVAAAADLRFALETVAREGGIGIEPTYGSSGNLYAQITQGAPFDVFLSADVRYADRVKAAGLADAVFGYARGRLAVWVPEGSPLDVGTEGLRALVRAEAARVSIANPEHAPYGRAAIEALAHAGIEAAVRPRLVFGDNVSQALEFVRSGNAQAGIVALSLVQGTAIQGSYGIVPAEAHAPLDQAGVILNRSRLRAEASALRDFLLSDQGQAILLRHGFERP